MPKPVFYKVCRVIDDKLYSAILNPKSAIAYDNYTQYLQIEVKYKFGQWIYPTLKNSKLFVFSDFVSAQNFKDTESRYTDKQMVIYPCWVKGTPERVCQISSLWSAYHIIDWWTKHVNNMSAPIDTYAVDGLFLLHRI